MFEPNHRFNKERRTATRTISTRRDFAPWEQYIHTLRLTSELVDLRVGYANPLSLKRLRSSELPIQQKNKDSHKDCPYFLVEAAGLEPTVSSTRNWRDTTFATPRNEFLKLRLENYFLLCYFLRLRLPLKLQQGYYSIRCFFCQLFFRKLIYGGEYPNRLPFQGILLHLIGLFFRQSRLPLIYAYY